MNTVAPTGSEAFACGSVGGCGKVVTQPPPPLNMHSWRSESCSTANLDVWMGVEVLAYSFRHKLPPRVCMVGRDGFAKGGRIIV